jgi:hypothetical protein
MKTKNLFGENVSNAFVDFKDANACKMALDDLLRK